VGDISKVVQTRSSIASFCEHFSFVSCIERNRVDEELLNVDWLNAMHEELNNFTHNEVWELVERPKNHNVIGTKWMFHNKHNEDRLVVRKGKISGNLNSSCLCLCSQYQTLPNGCKECFPE
jgi:hypothetical protein